MDTYIISISGGRGDQTWQTEREIKADCFAEAAQKALALPLAMNEIIDGVWVKE